MAHGRSIVGLLAVAAVSVTLIACGDSEDDTAGSASDAKESCTPKHAGLKTIKPGVLSVNAYVSPPYTVQDGKDITGVDGLVIKRIADMECLTLEAKSVAGPALPASIQSKRADVAIGGVYHSDERAKSFSLSEPMYQDGLSLLSKDGIDSLEGLSGKKLGVIQGYLWNEEFQKALGTGGVKVYQSSASMISDIKNGRVDAGAFTSAEAGYRAQQDPSLKAGLLQPTPEIAESDSKSDVVLFLAKDSTALTRAFDDDIAALLADGTVADALKRNGIDPSLAAKGS